MKNLKKIVYLLLVAVMFLLPVSKVNAVEDTIDLGSAPKTPAYVGDFSFEMKQMTNGEWLYCTNYYALTAKDVKAKLIGKMDKGITYILENGYPNKSITGDGTKDYYITQVAVWWYLDDTTGSSNLTSAFKARTDSLMDTIKSLKEKAKSATKTETSIDISNANTKMSLNGDYYETESITPKTSNLSKYTVELSGLDKADVININGEVQNSFNVNERELPFPLK